MSDVINAHDLGVAGGYIIEAAMQVDIDQLKAENAKLRDLVQDMWPHVRHRSRMCSKCDLPCDTSDECLLYEPMRQRMHDLGVEVDDGSR